jgi:hypothetical protein
MHAVLIPSVGDICKDAVVDEPDLPGILDGQRALGAPFLPS